MNQESSQSTIEQRFNISPENENEKQKVKASHLITPKMTLEEMNQQIENDEKEQSSEIKTKHEQWEEYFNNEYEKNIKNIKKDFDENYSGQNDSTSSSPFFKKSGKKQENEFEQNSKIKNGGQKCHKIFFIFIKIIIAYLLIMFLYPSKTFFFLAFCAFLYIFESYRRQTQKVSKGLQDKVVQQTSHEWVLYHNNFSIDSKKIRACLAELEIDYESQHVDILETGNWSTITSEFLKINPSGTVPVLLHNGKPIYNIDAQLSYLTQNFVEKSNLIPVKPNDLKIMNEWIKIASFDRKSSSNSSVFRTHAGNCVDLLSLSLQCSIMKYIPFYKVLYQFLFHEN